MELLYGASAGRVIPLKDVQNLSYLGPVYFTDSFQGADAPQSEFVYDTGSGDLTVTSTNCTEGCKTQYYDQAASSTAQVVPNSETQLSYGSATLDGVFVKDTVCLATELDFCVDDFKFFEIVEAKGLDQDGILGFSPINTKTEGSSMI